MAPSTGFLSLGLRSVDPGAVRGKPSRRVILPHRRRSIVVSRCAEGAHAGFQHPDALEHLDHEVFQATSCIFSIRRCKRRSASRRCSRRRRSSKAGRTTARDDGRGGFRKDDATVRLGARRGFGQLPASLVAIRLHCEDLSVERNALFATRRSRGSHRGAVKRAGNVRSDVSGVFDRQIEMLKLRRDYRDQQAGKFSLATSTMRCWPGGTHRSAHRRLLLDDGRQRSSSRHQRAALRDVCDACGERFELIGNFTIRRRTVCGCGQGAGEQAASRRRFSSGLGRYITDYRRKRCRRRGADRQKSDAEEPPRERG